MRRVLGIDLSADAVAGMFERLDLQVSRDGDDFVVTPPSHRFDVEIEEDLIEEIARIHGYDNIPIRHAPRLDHDAAAPEAKRDAMSLRRQVAPASTRKSSTSPSSKRPGRRTSPATPTRCAWPTRSPAR